MSDEILKIEREKVYLNAGWRFSAREPRQQDYDAYRLTKTGAEVSPASMSYDDHSWEKVCLPHDFMVLQELDPLQRDYNGYLEQKNCWYRRFFKLSKDDKKKRLVLHLDGVSGESQIWVNGCLMLVRHSAYLDAVLDITDVVRFGDAVNLIAVYMDHSQMQGWWYQGGGLYRDVWLEKMNRIYIDGQDLQIITEERESKWVVKACFTVRARYGWLENSKCDPAGVYATVTDPKGDKVGEIKASLIENNSCKSGARVKSVRSSMEFQIENPDLWDIYQGNCYRLDIQISENGRICDRYQERFGIRSIDFDSENGFYLNGKRREIRGFCFHEDEGNLGLAVEASVYERRIRYLIGMGANAYRCSHNAPAKELLDLCDTYGILVMDETRRFDTGEVGRGDLRQLVRRDRNHPSVIMWSLGNEEPWQGEERGYRIAETMKSLVYELDPTRPVTMAMHNGLNGGSDEENMTAADAVDVVGVNYNHERLEEIRRRYPNKPLIGSETLNLADTVVECGNHYSGSEGAYETLEFARSHSYYSGTFAWAGADYRGEHRNLGFFTDACPLNCNGGKKDGFYQYAARWREEPIIHICGHWNATEEKEREVVVYSNMESIELYLNKKLWKIESVNNRQQAVFHVPYQAGELKAVGIRKEERVSDVCRTSGEACSFRVHSEKTEYPADGESRITVWIEAVDEAGNLVPTASHIFEVRCGNLAEVVCADNADPYCGCFPRKEEMCLYRGSGKAVLKCGRQEGKLTVHITGMLKEASCEVNLVSRKPDNQETRSVLIGREIYRTEHAPVIENPYINDWFVTHIYQEEPDIYEYTTDDNYIYWRKSLEMASQLDKELPFYFSKGGGYVIYCMEPDMPIIEDEKMGAIVFEEITGEAKILISMRDYSNRIQKRFFHEKKEVEGKAVRIPLPEIVSGDRLIVKLVIRGNHGKCGITGPVRFEM